MSQFYGFRVDKTYESEAEWNRNHDVYCSEVAE